MGTDIYFHGACFGLTRLLFYHFLSAIKPLLPHLAVTSHKSNRLRHSKDRGLMRHILMPLRCRRTHPARKLPSESTEMGITGNLTMNVDVSQYLFIENEGFPACNVSLL